MYEDLHKLITQMSSVFLSSNSVVLDIGTSTGEAILNINKNNSENLYFYGVDSSEVMLKIAMQKCAHVRNVQFIHSDIENFIFPQSHLILSIYTLQFLDITKRMEIIKKAYNSLNKGGAFILCDKVMSVSKEIEEKFIVWHEEFKLNSGLNIEEIELKKQSLKNVLMPIPISDYLLMLNKVGFIAIDVFFKYLNFIGILAIK